VFFDVLHGDGTQTSNRKLPGSGLDDIDGDLLAKPYLEAQDRKIAEMSITSARSGLPERRVHDRPSRS
jgi:hypothetical protein